MDLRSTKESISKAESNEQQRNWNPNLWDKKSNDSLANYDPTRAELNFEVVRGGKIQPIDKSKSIDEKMNEILQARGIRNPNDRPNVKRPQRILAQMIFGGNRERMLEIAFGDQNVDLSKGADNSEVRRSKDIERWAVDVYNFAARKFGEENIVSFYVHLDEMNPHIHCTVLPVDEEKKKISWTSVFGNNPREEGETMKKTHDELYEEVNKYWGLERGSDIKETGAKHRSTEEYKRDLVNEIQELEETRDGLQKQIHRSEIKLKGLTTMIANLQIQKEKINEEIERLTEQLEKNGQDKDQLVKKIESLRREETKIDAKISERKEMLEETNRFISDAKEKLDGLKQEHARMSNVIGDNIDQQAEKIHANITGSFYKMAAHAIQPVVPTLNNEQKEILEESGYFDLTENAAHIINCALYLAVNYIEAATNYATSCGGGGGGNMSGWGRKKDDDDDRWWMKCIMQAASMVRPGRKRGRSR